MKETYTSSPPTAEQLAATHHLRLMFQDLARMVVEGVPDNRARSVALTNLQQAGMWVVQAVVDGPEPQQDDGR